MKKFIIKDWAGNILKGKTMSGIWVDLEFESFEDGWDYLYQTYDEDDLEDLLVEPK